MGVLGKILSQQMRRLVQDDSGVTAVEFGIIALPMCVLLLGGLDLGYQSYLVSTTQGALNQSARTAAVENPEFSTEGESISEKVENGMRDLLGNISHDATIAIETKSYFDFSGVGNAEVLMTDNNNNGEYDDDDGDCFEDANDNGDFDLDSGSDGIGGANDVVFYTAQVSYPRFMPWHKFADGLSDTVNIEVETAIRSQPYAEKRTPAVICGTP